MNLLAVTTHVPPAQGWGGVLTANVNRNRGFQACGWQVQVIATDGCRKNDRISEADVAAATPGLPTSLCRHWWFPRYGFAPSVIPKTFEYIRKSDFVFIGGIATWPVTIAAIICMMLGKPFAVAIHGGLLAEHVREIQERKFHKWIFYCLITFPTLRAARFVNVASEFEAAGVRLVSPDVRIVVTPNAVDLTDFDYTPAPESSGGAKLIYVGRLSPEKGVLALAKAWLDIAGPEDRLEIVGSGAGRYAKEVLRFIEGHPRILFTGELRPKEVMARLSDSHGLVLPSGLDGPLKENFGNVVAEAMALGRPALAPRGLAWDAIEAEGAGFLFDPTPEDLRSALRRFIALSHDERRRAGERARRFAERNLDITNSTVELARVIEGL